MPNADVSSPDRVNVSIQHATQIAVREWQAEEENSRRLAARANGVLATIAAAGGLGLFKLSDLPTIEPSWLNRAVAVAIVVSGACVVIGLIHIWGARPPRWTEDEPWWWIPRKVVRFLHNASRSKEQRPERAEARHPFASSWLHTLAAPGTSHPVEDPDLLLLDSDAIRRMEYYRTRAAALDLYGRNVERQNSLTCGQAWLGRAVLVAFTIAAACPTMGHGTH